MAYVERFNLLTNLWQRERMRKLDPTPTPAPNQCLQTNTFHMATFTNRYMSITWRISDYIYTKLWFVIARPCLKFTGSLIKEQYNQGMHILQRNIGVITYLFWFSPIRFNWKIVSEKWAILSESERVKFGVGWVTIKYINISVVTSKTYLILV